MKEKWLQKEVYREGGEVKYLEFWYIALAYRKTRWFCWLLTLSWLEPGTSGFFCMQQHSATTNRCDPIFLVHYFKSCFNNVCDIIGLVSEFYRNWMWEGEEIHSLYLKHEELVFSSISSGIVLLGNVLLDLHCQLKSCTYIYTEAFVSFCYSFGFFTIAVNQ